MPCQLAHEDVFGWIHGLCGSLRQTFLPHLLKVGLVLWLQSLLLLQSLSLLLLARLCSEYLLLMSMLKLLRFAAALPWPMLPSPPWLGLLLLMLLTLVLLLQLLVLLLLRELNFLLCLMLTELFCPSCSLG